MRAGQDALRLPRRIFYALAGCGIVLIVLAAVSLVLDNVALAGAFFVAAVVFWIASRSVYAGYWRWERTEGVRRAIVRLETRVDEAQGKSQGKN